MILRLHCQHDLFSVKLLILLLNVLFNMRSLAPPVHFNAYSPVVNAKLIHCRYLFQLVFLARSKNVAALNDFYSSVFRTKSGNSAFSGDSGDFSLKVLYKGRKL